MILSMIGIIGLVWFATPMVLKRIVNIGNLTGLALCLVLIAYGIFRKQINAFVVKFWTCVAGKIVISAVMLVASVILILAIVETTLMVKACMNTSDEPSTVVVLGCKVNGERPSRMLGERLNAAYDYLVKNPDAVCVVSGGQGADEGISEAECMYRYLVEKGIDKSRIFKEDKSTSTRENLLFSSQVIEENNLNKKMAIVTNEFHEYRAGEIAKKLDIEYSAVPAKTNLWLLPTYYVRELYGILYEWIF